LASSMNMQFIESYPMKVLLAGFESDTLRLQSCGWQFSVHQERSDGRYKLLVTAKHEGISQLVWFHPIDINYINIINDIKKENFVKNIVLEAAYMSSQIQTRIIPMNFQPNFTAVDMRPGFVEHKEFNLEDLAVFKPVNVNEDFEIYLNKKDEAEILELLLKKQDPKQKEIRENRRNRAWRNEKEGYNPYNDISRQIIIAG